jgi:hypothetical protein
MEVGPLAAWRLIDSRESDPTELGTVLLEDSLMAPGSPLTLGGRWGSGDLGGAGMKGNQRIRARYD